MQADIHVVRGPDEHIRQSWSAAGAEYYPRLAKGAVNLFVPPAGVPEFDNIAACRIELADNFLEAGVGIATTRRKLEQEAAHLVAQNVGDQSEIPNEGLWTFKLLYMSDELANLHGVHKLLFAGRASPSLNAGYCRP